MVNQDAKSVMLVFCDGWKGGRGTVSFLMTPGRKKKKGDRGKKRRGTRQLNERGTR